MKKKITKKSEPLTDDVEFCTECGEELNELCFEDQVNDKEFLKKNHENCIKTGKFKGDVCSRMFIANDSGIEEILLDE